MYFQTRAERFATDQMRGVRRDVPPRGFGHRLLEALSCPHLGGETRRSWAGGKVRSSELDTGTGDGGVSAAKTPGLKIHSALFMGETL